MISRNTSCGWNTYTMSGGGGGRKSSRPGDSGEPDSYAYEPVLSSRPSDVKPSPDPMLPFSPSEEFLQPDVHSSESKSKVHVGSCR